jgi:hypothetical protein
MGRTRSKILLVWHRCAQQVASSALTKSHFKEAQHRSVLRAIHTLNSPKNYICLLKVFLPIHTTRRRGAQDLMRDTRGPFPPVAAMVGYGCVCQCWPLEANIRSTYCRNSKNCLQKYFFLFLRMSHTFLTSDPVAK